MIGSAEEYIERLRSYKREIYVLGKKIDNFADHPNIRPTVNAFAYTYELAKTRDEFAPYSDLVGEKVNRLNYMNKTPEDLMARFDYQRELSKRMATCNYRCTGCDAINAIYPATKALDEREGTDYHQRFLKLLKEIQKNDYACTAALTDVKGDRSKRPAEQRDMFLHVVEKREDGIVVSGAKVHQSGAFAADVNFVLPTQTFKQGEEEFAIVFAVMPEDEGVKYIIQNTGVQAKQREDGEFEPGNVKYGDRTTCMVVFDNVFIPWERVFIFEDLKAARDVLNYFAASHRCAGAACKAGFIDSMVGAASLMLKANGLENVAVLQQKIAEMVAVSEGAYGISIGAAAKGYKANDSWQPNQYMANAGKIIGVEGFTKSLVNLIDIAGGIIGTSPSEFDMKGELGEKVSKYMSASEKFTPEQRMKIVKFIEFWATSSHLIGAVHGGGSPAASLITLRFIMDIEDKEKAVKNCLDL
ncbi:4-hydroxyphenylacetate 3-hydroxylase N-terminal domain-containing protein [Archaeoglobus sp.]